MFLALQSDAIGKALELWPVLTLAFVVVGALAPIIVFLFRRYEKEREARRIERDEAHKREIESRDRALKDTLESHERATKTLADELARAIQLSAESSNRVVTELAAELRTRRRS